MSQTQRVLRSSDSDATAYYETTMKKKGIPRASGGNCTKGPGERPWFLNEKKAGRLFCYKDNEGDVWVVWKDSHTAIVATACETAAPTSPSTTGGPKPDPSIPTPRTAHGRTQQRQHRQVPVRQE